MTAGVFSMFSLAAIFNKDLHDEKTPAILLLIILRWYSIGTGR
jgi:hypothetical protein